MPALELRTGDYRQSPGTCQAGGAWRCRHHFGGRRPRIPL